MPYKANEARRHKIPRARYKVRNWPEYEPDLAGGRFAQGSARDERREVNG